MDGRSLLIEIKCPRQTVLILRRGSRYSVGHLNNFMLCFHNVWLYKITFILFIHASFLLVVCPLLSITVFIISNNMVYEFIGTGHACSLFRKNVTVNLDLVVLEFLKLKVLNLKRNQSHIY